MNIANVKPILSASTKAGNKPILLRGLAGIGKSKIVEQWAKENDYHYEEMFLSAVEIGDIIGIPYRVDGVTHHAKPIIFERMDRAYYDKGKKCVLFLDEFSRGALDVTQSALQLVLNQRIHEIQLPKDTLIVLADNPVDSGYNVNSMDPAMLNRLLVLDVEPDVESWLAYASKNGVHHSVRNFIAQNPTRLHFVPEDDTEALATPRSWESLGEFANNFKDTPKEFWSSIAMGLVGRAVGAQFITFFENYKNVVKLEDVVKVAEEIYVVDKSIAQATDAVKDFIKDVEAIQKMDFANELIEKICDNSVKEDVVALVALLNAFEIETLAAVMKDQQKKDVLRYIKMVALSKEFFNGENALVEKILNSSGHHEEGK